MGELMQLDFVQIIGSIYWDNHHGVVSFNVKGIPRDVVASIMDMDGVLYPRRPPLRAAAAHLAGRREPCLLPRQRAFLLTTRPTSTSSSPACITFGARSMGNLYTSTTFMEHNSHPDYRYEMDAPTHEH